MGTTVPKAGKDVRENNGLWRLHCAFDLPAERFSFIELTDEKGGERLDRTPVAKGDILVADRGFMHPDPLAHVLEQGADIVVRTGWKGARWLDDMRKLRRPISAFDLPQLVRNRFGTRDTFT